MPRRIIYPVDPSIDALTASVAEPVAVCVHALHLARPDVDSRMLVLGAGAIGLIAGLLARDRVGRVGITARYPHQREAARRLGLEPLGEAEAGDWAQEHQPDVVLETVGGEAETINDAIEACARGGRVVVLGVFTGPTSIDALRLVTKEITLAGSVVYGAGRSGPEFGAAVSLLPRYAEELRGLQTHQFALEDIHQAFATAADKKSGAIKVTILPDGPGGRL